MTKRAKPDTWMPFFIGDYLKDTSRLTTEQHGAYLLLILDYWTNGPPPDDDAVLSRISGLERRAWAKTRPVLQRLFRPEDGLWRHKRIDQELAGALERSGKAAARAKSAAEARWHGEKSSPPDAPSNACSIPQALDKQCLSDALHLSPVTLPPPEERSSGGGAARGSRISEAWLPSPEDAIYAGREGFSASETMRMAEAFRDYWLAQPGAKGRKSDWSATWRGWVRREADRQAASPRPKRQAFV